MYEEVATALGISVIAATLLITIVSLWELVWKGIALWYSGGKKQKIWFICILIFNTVGILPIIYLLIYKPWKGGAKNEEKDSDLFDKQGLARVEPEEDETSASATEMKSVESDDSEADVRKPLNPKTGQSYGSVQ